MSSPPFVKLEGAHQMSEQAFKEHPLAVLVNRIAGRLADASMLVACFILLWLVGLTCVDVVGRYFFRARDRRNRTRPDLDGGNYLFLASCDVPSR